jgi:uroporphyrin-III C-methyltransferase
MEEFLKLGDRARGKVYLVGAGPGDPELLTVKAANKIRSADIVLHDALVSAEVLALVPNSANVLNVGKRCGVKSITQNEINSMMVHFVAEGNVVVRLKSGDPSIFGRAGEEISALREAGVEFEVIPGITSALAAASAARIPLTDRRYSDQLLFISAHHADEKTNPDWQHLIFARTTVVIYMPGNHVNIAEQLMRAGADNQTPCVIISRISMPGEMAYQTSLGKLPETPELPAPSLLIIGATAGISACPEFKELLSSRQ